MLTRYGWILAALVAAACGPVKPPPTPQPPPYQAHQVVVTVRGHGVALKATGTLWDDAGHVAPCGWTADPRTLCDVPPEMPQGNGFHLGLDADGWKFKQLDFVSCIAGVASCWPVQDLVEVALDADAPSQPPIGAKADYWLHYQGDFGTKKLAGCGLHMDANFGPFLFERWVNNRACYEQMLAQHAAANDNRIVVDPRSGYRGFNDIDVWHDPGLFAQFLADVRAHTNANGEHYKVRVVLAADGHIDDMHPAESFEHWKRDIDALAAVTQDLMDATQECWECRHQNDYVSAKVYVDMGRYIARAWPRAVHGEHLISNSSSWSSWKCDPRDSTPERPCRVGVEVDERDADDPNRGNEINAWHNCRAEGWCDLFLYQFDVGSSYLYPSPGNDAMERWVEIVERLGDDPRSLVTSGGDRHTWPQVPVVADEFIYDAYWARDPKANEAYAIEWCKRALAFGGWGCGSASWRLP